MLRRGVALIAVGLLGAAAAHARADEAPAPEATPAAPAAQLTPAAEVAKPAKAKQHRRKRRQARPDLGGFHVGADLRAVASAGGLAGEGTLRESAAMTLLEAEVTPFAERGRWRLELPVEVAHRQAFGASLDETRGAIDLGARWRRGPSLRLEAELGVRAVWRPDWPDQYQPLPDGSLEPTDRYSHWDRRAGLRLAAIPWRHQHVRLAWRYTLVDQTQDPSFDAIDEPTHLTPGDRDEHELSASWRWYGERWNAGVGVDASWTSYFFQFARDAGTGRTHAGAGGPPPNPLYESVAVEPELLGELDLAGGDAELDVSYGFEIVDDTYQGYYSYTGHHPSAKLRWQRGRWELGARVDVKLRTYGDGSYAAGPDHPPLTSGDRRVDRRATGGLSARYALDASFAVVADAAVTARRTNFPAYVPGVFPDTRQYDIDWNYENWAITVGVEVRR